MPSHVTAISFPIEGMESGWQAGGYFGGGNVVNLLDSLHGRPAIVAGSGGTIDDIAGQFQTAMKELDPGNQRPIVFAVNDVGAYLPLCDHLVSLHNDNLIHWAALRQDKHERASFRTHSLRGADYEWTELTPTLALSGYFAMQIAYLMGCEPIVLVGCPGDDTKRFFDLQPTPAGKHSTRSGIERQLRLEMQRLPAFRAKVRSMSGWTREFFGGLEG